MSNDKTVGQFAVIAFSIIINIFNRTEFSTAAFRFGHTLIRQTFGAGTNRQVSLLEMFESFNTVDTYGEKSPLLADNLSISKLHI